MHNVIATCELCGHKADVNVAALPETLVVPETGRRLLCSQCGGKRIDTRPPGKQCDQIAAFASGAARPWIGRGHPSKRYAHLPRCYLRRGDVSNRRIVWKNSQNDRSRKSRFLAPNLICAGNRHDEAHGRATRGKIARAADPPAEFSFKAVYGGLNCDRREKSSFSTQSAHCRRP